MSIVVLLVVVAVIGAVTVVLAGRNGAQAEFEPDRPPFQLPDGALGQDDIDGVRFAVGLRGYRMDQVDLVMDRLAAELVDRDRRIVELGGTPPVSARASSAAAAIDTSPAEPAPADRAPIETAPAGTAPAAVGETTVDAEVPSDGG